MLKRKFQHQIEVNTKHPKINILRKKIIYSTNID